MTSIDIVLDGDGCCLTLRFELPDGTTALAQAKLEMLETIVRAILAELKAKGGSDS